MGVMACIEITNICNCHCSFCPYPIMTRKKEIMPIDLVKNAIDQVADLGLDCLCLHVLGEPTLHPQIEEILKYCASKNLPMKFTSNGTTDKFATVVPLVTQGKIYYSLQTPEDLYYMKGSPITWNEQINKLKQAVKAFLTSGNIRNVGFEIHLLDTRKVKEVKVLDSDEKIFSSYLFFSSLFEEIEKELGIAKYERCMLHITPGAYIPMQQNVFLHLKAFSTFGGVATQEIIKNEFIFCVVPKDQVVILVNGDVIQCCLNSENPFILGNIKHTSLEEIREGPRFEELRLRCTRNLPALANCRKCEKAG